MDAFERGCNLHHRWILYYKGYQLNKNVNVKDNNYGNWSFNESMFGYIDLTILNYFGDLSVSIPTIPMAEWLEWPP